MNSVTLYTSYVLIIATIHMLILTRLGEALPIGLTIPSFLPYLPKSLFTWGIDDAAELQIPNAEANADQKRGNPDKAKENPSNEDWDWTILPPSVWTNLLMTRNPEKYWLPTESIQITEPSRITKASEPALTAIARPKMRIHRHRHSQKNPSHLLTKAVLSTVIQDQAQSTTTLTTTTEIPIVQKRTKLSRSRNPLCYFTALPCAD
ncbi:hypothetical protein Ddc_10265 [Ditylenchus destructor]|nr:hypothetical protein Ddc_10265 [Ditylenchus destructor]